MNFFVEKHTDW